MGSREGSGGAGSVALFVYMVCIAQRLGKGDKFVSFGERGAGGTDLST